MDYKELLYFQPILSNNVEDYIRRLSTGQLTTVQFHNKKYYARKNKNLTKILELAVAFEIYKALSE